MTSIDPSIDRPLLTVENISIVMGIVRESDSSGISKIWCWCNDIDMSYYGDIDISFKPFQDNAI